MTFLTGLLKVTNFDFWIQKIDYFISLFFGAQGITPISDPKYAFLTAFRSKNWWISEYANEPEIEGDVFNWKKDKYKVKE